MYCYFNSKSLNKLPSPFHRLIFQRGEKERKNGEMEARRRPPSLVDIGDSAIKEIWLPWPLATAHNSPQHQRAAAVYAKGEGGMKIEKEDEGRKQRGKSLG